MYSNIMLLGQQFAVLGTIYTFGIDDPDPIYLKTCNVDLLYPILSDPKYLDLAFNHYRY